MGEMSVHEVVLNATDPVGAAIVNVYAKNAPHYAVYRTRDRVLIHFADNDAVASAQRSQLAALGALRGEISGLVDGWHLSSNRKQRERAERFDKRVADALVTALEGDVASAAALLAASKTEIQAERTSLAQFKYLAWASFTAVFIMLVLVGVSTPQFAQIQSMSRDLEVIWLASGAGTFGAFFSIALGLQSRTILNDLQMRNNRSDAILRVMIGAIAAALVICLLNSGLLGTTALPEGSLTPGDKDYSQILVMVVGFIAGFSERMVPDLLSRTSFGGAAARGQEAVSVAASPSSTVVIQTAPRPAPHMPVVLPPPPPPVQVATAEEVQEEEEVCEDDYLDHCLCDLPVEESGDTTDAELPEATGAIEGSPDAPRVAG